MNVLHSAVDPDWYTPARIVDAARLVMGSIELDPCSDAVANQVVQADAYYTVQDNGLERPWGARSVFINPPGHQVGAFWDKLMKAFHDHASITEAIWVGFSLEQLQTLQNQSTTGLTPMDFPICIPSSRIAFTENAAKLAARRGVFLEKTTRARAIGDLVAKFQEKASPPHGNYITYLGNRYARFEQYFRPIGACRP